MKKFLIPKLIKTRLKDEFKMNFGITLILVVICFQNANSRDWATAQIFACEPEWGSLAKEIVGNKAKVVVAINEFENPHFAQAQPYLLSDIRKADIVFCSGADLEVKWLPALLANVNKKDIKVGGSGYLMASDYVKKLATPENADNDLQNSSTKNIHPLGNPHIHLNPNNIPPIATEFLTRILAIDPSNAKFYQKNYDDFITRWNLAVVGWEFKAKDLKNMKIIVVHNQWDYLADWLDLKIVGNIEEKPGTIPPTSQYLLQVLKQFRVNSAELMIYSPFEDAKSVFWFSDRAMIKAIVLPYTVVSVDSPTQNLFGMFDEIIKRLVTQNKNQKEIDFTNQP